MKAGADVCPDEEAEVRSGLPARTSAIEEVSRMRTEKTESETVSQRPRR